MSEVKVELSHYEHFISLGGNCYVAEDLKKLGLRDCSYPLDWCFSDDFSGIISAITLKFENFVSKDFLLQHDSHRSRYYNEKYKLSFYHDFTKYLPLNKQIEDVAAKYSRRITRFFKDISEPTVFFRYIISKNYYDYIFHEHKNIDALLKSFCSDNRIIYLCHSDLLKNCDVEWFLLEKDENDWITRNPLTKNVELRKMLCEIEYADKDRNIAFASRTKTTKKDRFSFERSFRRLLNKEYIHDKVYKKD